LILANEVKAFMQSMQVLIRNGEFENLLKFIENSLPEVNLFKIDFRSVPQNFILDLQVLVYGGEKARQCEKG
jgi:hypothetical protein